MISKRVDVVVVGAGPGGAHVAGRFAQHGRTVALIDRRPMSDAGAQWHNGVLPWQFSEAGVAPPVPSEISGRGHAHMVGPDGRRAFVIDDGPIIRADMGKLGSSLRAVASEAGVEMLDRVSSVEPDVDRDGRVRVVEFDRAEADDGPTGRFRLEADLVVDAAGRSGVVRRRSPALARWCPEVVGGELCSATDAEFAIADPDGARRFLDRHGARPGDSVSVMGCAGGWSMKAVRVSDDLQHAGALVGCIANGRYGTGPGLMADLRREHAWLGDPVAMWSGVIPLRRPYARFTAPGLALVGDSACQVFPAHGSGIGLGLMAGTMLVEATAKAADCGDEDTLWRYQHRFQQRHGGVLAGLDAFRRMTTALGTDGIDRMVSANLFDPTVARATLAQQIATPRVASLPGMLWGLATHPKLAAVMVPWLTRGALVRAQGARYPERVDLEALARWDRRVERLLGPLPE